MSHRTRLSVVLVLVSLASAAALTVGPASGSGPAARAAKGCSLKGYYRSLGPSYVTSLSVRNTSCATGRSVVRAYYSCRINSGGRRGHCHHKVLGFSCSESRSGISIQFDASVNCNNGSRHVHHNYTQNT